MTAKTDSAAAAKRAAPAAGVAVVTLDNVPAGEIQLSDEIFAQPVRRDILARMVNYQRARRRAGTHQVKNRSDVTGTTAKMGRQKGGGRARHGSAKAPQFRGGGRVFGPQMRDHAHKLPKKLRALALKMALSAKRASGKLLILDAAMLSAPKTKDLAGKFRALGMHNAMVVGGEALDHNFTLAARNLPLIDVLPASGANVYDILRRDMLVLTRDAVTALEARLK